MHLLVSPELNTFQTYLQRWRAGNRERNIPSISPANATFLCQLLQLHRPMRVLEIGTANGISAATIAHTLAGWGGHLTTIEISVPTHAEAQTHFDALALSNITALQGDAREQLTIGSLSQKRFDLIFIDAQKSQTHVFYQLCCAVLNAHGLMIVDDVWLHRDKMKHFYQLLQEKSQSYQLHFIDAGDATMVLTFENTS